MTDLITSGESLASLKFSEQLKHQDNYGHMMVRGTSVLRSEVENMSAQKKKKLWLGYFKGDEKQEVTLSNDGWEEPQPV